MNEFDNTDPISQTPLGEGASSIPPLGAGASYLYNITTQVMWDVHEAWLAWMLDEHIPAILGTGCFVRHQVVRLLETDETEGPVYAVQYYVLHKALYNTFINDHQPGFKKLEHARWGNSIFSFTSLMQVVN